MRVRVMAATPWLQARWSRRVTDGKRPPARTPQRSRAGRTGRVDFRAWCSGEAEHAGEDRQPVPVDEHVEGDVYVDELVDVVAEPDVALADAGAGEHG